MHSLFTFSPSDKTSYYLKFKPVNKKIIEKMQKQIQHLSKEHKNIFYEFIVEKYVVPFNEIATYVEQHNSTIDDLVFHKNNCLQIYMSGFTNLYMDLYIMGRLLRSFGKNHISSKINIIYTGAAHSKTYFNFFQLKPQIEIKKATNNIKIPKNVFGPL